MHNHDPIQTPGNEPGPGPGFPDRWADLEPDDRALIQLALDALLAGDFAWFLAWQRFVDAAMELVPSLSDGVISIDELRMRGLFPTCIPDAPSREG